MFLNDVIHRIDWWDTEYSNYNELIVISKAMINSNEISVVLQGAFDKRLTLEAIQSIKAFLPKCELILST